VLMYEIDRPGMVSIVVFSLDGSVVRVLHRGRMANGEYSTTWDGRNNTGDIVARGIYFVRFVAPGIDEYRKVIVAKD
jgi:flagellar hook assembly protein FlgD